MIHQFCRYRWNMSEHLCFQSNCTVESAQWLYKWWVWISGWISTVEDKRLWFKSKAVFPSLSPPCQFWAFSTASSTVPALYGSFTSRKAAKRGNSVLPKPDLCVCVRRQPFASMWSARAGLVWIWSIFTLPTILVLVGNHPDVQAQHGATWHYATSLKLTCSLQPHDSTKLG